MGPWLQQSPGAGGQKDFYYILQPWGGGRNALWAAPVPASRALPLLLVTLGEQTQSLEQSC